jgi:predicted ATPase
MIFKVLSRNEFIPNEPNVVFLVRDNWNDYAFHTLFYLNYTDEKLKHHELGNVKIGRFGQEENEMLLEGIKRFTELDENYFSLGLDDVYYERINNIGQKFRDEILISLKDIAKDADLYERAISERVTQVSLLRGISPFTITGQYRRMTLGGVRLTSYDFRFETFNNEESHFSPIQLDFNVIPDSIPPTNIHVIIGRNGVGKTKLITNMISTLFDENRSKCGVFNYHKNSREEKLFGNLVAVSFSAFDESIPVYLKESEYISYSYVGLKRSDESGNTLSPKTPELLKKEFIESLSGIRSRGQIDFWSEIIHLLDSDPIFKETNISEVVKLAEKLNDAGEGFGKLSSGHKIILLTITKLVETIKEKSLLLLDEPESHLHPPLLSSFIRALSELLIYKNGVAIIATHSPVILQEVPKACVWKLRRSGSLTKSERLVIESFGENVGTLTREVFGLEVTHSGFHKLIAKAIEDTNSYEEAVAKFGNQLGMDAKGIIRVLMINKNKF